MLTMNTGTDVDGFQHKDSGWKAGPESEPQKALAGVGG